MSKFSKLGLRRAAGACAIAAVAAVGAASMGAGAAEAAPLPNGYKYVDGFDGEKIETWRTGESSRPAHSVANNGAGRSVTVNGTYTAKGSGGAAGKLQVGFLVGCQIDLTGFEGGLSGSLAGAVPSLSGSISVPLNPGQVTTVVVNSKSFDEDGVASVQLSNFEIDVQQCGGYASARSIAQVIGGPEFEVDDDDGTVYGSGTLIQTSLYGKPFSFN